MSRTIPLSYNVIAAAALANSMFCRRSRLERRRKGVGQSRLEMPGGVYRWSAAERLKVSLDGVAIKPGFALGGWVAFQRMGSQAMVMGDVVLTQAKSTPS